MFRTTIACCLIALLAACSTTSPDVVGRGDAQHMSTVLDATVLAIRPVTVEGSQSGVGAAAGAAVGGIAGSSVGGRREQAAVGVLGAVVGGVVGNAVERQATRESAEEILVQLANGERRAIVQARGADVLNPGDAVLIIQSGGKVRVTRSPAVAPAAAPAGKPQPAPAQSSRS